MKMFKLMNSWIKMDVASEAARDPNRASSQRVIPKWESIKDLPGVMYCENMKEILERNVRAGTLLTAQCVCLSYKSYEDLGYYDSRSLCWVRCLCEALQL